MKLCNGSDVLSRFVNSVSDNKYIQMWNNGQYNVLKLSLTNFIHFFRTTWSWWYRKHSTSETPPQKLSTPRSGIKLTPNLRSRTLQTKTQVGCRRSRLEDHRENLQVCWINQLKNYFSIFTFFAYKSSRHKWTLVILF